MSSSNNRVATNYAVSRKQKRYIAKQNMKKAGIRQICKPFFNGKWRSFFSINWRNFVEEVNA